MRRSILLAVAAFSMLWAVSPANAARADARKRGAQRLVEAKAGELLLTLHVATNGIGLVGLRDLTLDEPLLATNALPLFSVTLRHAETKQELRLTAENGWLHTFVRRKRNGLELEWRQPTNENLGVIKAIATATLDQNDSAPISVSWTLARSVCGASGT